MMVASVDEGVVCRRSSSLAGEVDGNGLEVIRERWRRSIEYRLRGSGTDKVEGKDEW